MKWWEQSFEFSVEQVEYLIRFSCEVSLYNTWSTLYLHVTDSFRRINRNFGSSGSGITLFNLGRSRHLPLSNFIKIWHLFDNTLIAWTSRMVVNWEVSKSGSLAILNTY